MFIDIIYITDESAYINFPGWLLKLVKILLDPMPKLNIVRQKYLNIDFIEYIEESDKTGNAIIHDTRGNTYITQVSVEELKKQINKVMYGDQHEEPYSQGESGEPDTAQENAD